MSDRVFSHDYSLNGRNFTNNFYAVETPLPDYAKPLEGFFDIWQNARNGSKLPSRDDMGFETLKGWHSNVRLVDMGDNIEAQKKNLILGETYSRYWGQKLMITQIQEMEEDRKEFLAKYREALKYYYGHHYGISIGQAPHEDASHREIMWIDLPLADDGESMSHLITALVPV